ncbi:MAG: sigma-70 family RNA polymerase sigma factor [Caulobacter sp.]|nr:sigma-70 family RNA polymerase sigma factor [Caulobacter sp.]
MAIRKVERRELPASSPTALTVVRPAPSAQEMGRQIEAKLSSERGRWLRFLASRLPSRGDAEDVLQDFSIRAIQGAARLSDPQKIDAWLNVSLRNTLFDHYRREGARRRLWQGAASEPQPADHDDPDDDIETPMTCLSKAIDELRPAYTDLIRRAELQEAPLKLVASELALTANNVAVRLHRARAALRQSMVARCAACPVRCLAADRFLARRAD